MKPSSKSSDTIPPVENGVEEDKDAEEEDVRMLFIVKETNGLI